MNVNEILLKDTYFYNSHASYAQFLRKHGIDTVGKLLDSEYLTHATRGNTTEQLKVLISLYKYEYMGKPLGKDRILNRRVININNEPCGFNIHVESERGRITTYNAEDYIEKFLGVPSGSLYRAFAMVKEDKVLVETIKTQKFRILELLKWLLSYANAYPGKSGIAIRNIMRAYIESYGNDIKSIELGSNTIDILSSQMITLIKTRNDIDIKILELSRKIDSIKNVK